MPAGPGRHITRAGITRNGFLIVALIALAAASESGT